MALDRALLAGRAAGTSPPTLRLYRWERPTLTLGRFQDAADGRSRSGGRRVAWTSCAGPPADAPCCTTTSSPTPSSHPTADGVPRGVVASYRHFAAALAEAFRALGVPAQVTPASAGSAGVGGLLPRDQPGRPRGRAPPSSRAVAQVWERRRGAAARLVRRVARRGPGVGAHPAGAPRTRDALARATCTIADVTGRRPDVGRTGHEAVSARRSSCALGHRRSSRRVDRGRDSRSPRPRAEVQGLRSLDRGRPTLRRPRRVPPPRSRARVSWSAGPRRSGDRETEGTMSDFEEPVEARVIDIDARSNDELREMLDELSARGEGSQLPAARAARQDRHPARRAGPPAQGAARSRSRTPSPATT